jgi:hypothetical protein
MKEKLLKLLKEFPDTPENRIVVEKIKEIAKCSRAYTSIKNLLKCRGLYTTPQVSRLLRVTPRTVMHLMLASKTIPESPGRFYDELDIAEIKKLMKTDYCRKNSHLKETSGFVSSTDLAEMCGVKNISIQWAQKTGVIPYPSHPCEGFSKHSKFYTADEAKNFKAVYLASRIEKSKWEKTYLSTKSMAEYLGTSPATLKSHIESGVIPAPTIVRNGMLGKRYSPDDVKNVEKIWNLLCKKGV